MISWEATPLADFLPGLSNEDARQQGRSNLESESFYLTFNWLSTFQRDCLQPGERLSGLIPKGPSPAERAGGQGGLGRATHEGWTAARAFPGTAARPAHVPQPRAAAGRADSSSVTRALGNVPSTLNRLPVLDINFLRRHFRIGAFPSPYPHVHTCYNIIFRKQMKIMTPQELSKWLHVKACVLLV